MLNYHEAAMGNNYPEARRWTKCMVTEDHNILRDSHQVGVYCCLHAFVAQVLIQNVIPLHVLWQDMQNVSRE
jgi:hypothetical protein